LSSNIQNQRSNKQNPISNNRAWASCPWAKLGAQFEFCGLEARATVIYLFHSVYLIFDI